MPYKCAEKRREYQKIKMRQIRNSIYEKRDHPEIIPINKLYTFYKILCKNSNILDCYVGQTINFANRILQHKKSYKNGDSPKLYEFIRNNGGFENFYFEIICECNLSSLQEALDIEHRLIKEINPSLNTILKFHKLIKEPDIIDDLHQIKNRDGTNSMFDFMPVILTKKDELTLHKLIMKKFL